MVSTDPIKWAHCWMYLEVFLNTNIEIPVERGTFAFHTAIPTKY